MAHARPKKFNIADIKIDKAIEGVRLDERSQSRIEGYADNIDNLPPITIDTDNYIIDGVHRFYAHSLAERDKIACMVVEDMDAKSRRLRAVSLNANHGLGLTPAEMKHNAIELYKLNASDKEIAKAIGRSEATVHNYLQESKAHWKAEMKGMVWDLHEQGLKQAEIAKHINGIRPKSITQRTVSEYLKDYREQQQKAEEYDAEVNQQETADVVLPADTTPAPTLDVEEARQLSAEAQATPVPPVETAPPVSASKTTGPGSSMRIATYDSDFNDEDFDVDDLGFGKYDDFDDHEDVADIADFPDVDIDEDAVAAVASDLPDIKKFNREAMTFEVEDLDNINVALIAQAIAIHEGQLHLYSDNNERLQEFVSEPWEAVFVRQT